MIGNLHRSTVTSQRYVADIQAPPVHRASQEKTFEYYSCDVQLVFEKASGGVLIEILNDGRRVNIIEVFWGGRQ